MEPTTSKIAIRGCHIRLMRDGAGRPLVVLHGANGAGAWATYMRLLAGKFDVIVPEHPGFGESDTPDWFDNIHDLAYFYLDFLDSLALDHVHLVGISLGGWIAAELAVRDTKRLASLTLVGAAGIHLEGVAQLDPFLCSDEQRIRALFDDQSCADEMVKALLVPELADVAMKNQIATAKLAWQPRGYDPHLAKWLHRINVPTLLIWGAHDRLYPAPYADAWRQFIPGAKAVIFPDCGHVPHLERPEEFVSVLEDFIDGRRLAA